MSWIESPGEDIFQGLDLTRLKVDQAYVNVSSSRADAWLYSLSDDCHRCPYTRITKIGRQNTVLTADVAHGETWRVFSDGRNLTIPQEDRNRMVCEFRPDMGEFGVYNLRLDFNQCKFTEAKPPVNIYLPILVMFLILVGVTGLCKCIQVLSTQYLRKANPTTNMAEKDSNTTGKSRVKALDTFRGMSIVLMIFVNDGAGRYWWLEHATWNGLTVGDLVFPFFLWIMGACIPMSIKSVLNNNVPKQKALWNIFVRSCKLFLIGVALGSIYGPTLYKLRIFGVLQRFGITYYIVASLGVLLAAKPKEQSFVESKFLDKFKDVTDLAAQWLVMIVFIVVHLCITFLLPVPGCPRGYLGPGGKQDNWLFRECIGGATKYIDVKVLGDSHLYQNPTAKFVYDSGSFDPEGIFGCLLSIVHVFLGVQAGTTLLQHKRSWKSVVWRWLSWALLTGLAGGILCGFSKEGGVIPVNKNLWSLSFVLVTSCFAFLLLTACYLLVDVVKLWDGSPFVEPGMNSITLYVGHMLCYSIFPFHWAISSMRTHFIFLAEATWGTLLWILVAMVMANNKIFITL